MSCFEDEDGVDGPFSRAMARAEREDAKPKLRARFLRDGSGYTFAVLDRTGRIVRQGWCAGPKSEAQREAAGEIRRLESAELPAEHDIGGES